MIEIGSLVITTDKNFGKLDELEHWFSHWIGVPAIVTGIQDDKIQVDFLGYRNYPKASYSYYYMNSFEVLCGPKPLLKLCLNY